MDDILMGEVGPDDDFNEEEFAAPISNVTHISTAKLPRQGGKPILSVEDEDVLKQDAASRAAGKRKISNVIDVMENEEVMEFILQDVLPTTGLMFVGGLSATGKTILAIELVSNIVLGRPTMAWQLGEAAKDVRALMLSLEMPTPELQLRLKHMFPSLDDDERKVLQENFLTYSESEPLCLWDTNDVIDLIRMIKDNKVNLLLIDSASVSLAESLKDDAQVNKSLKNLYMIRSRLNCAMIIVAHTRKPPQGIESHPEDITLNELFGHSGVAQHASSIMLMIEDSKHRKATFNSGEADSTEKLVHVVNVKSRFGTNGGGYKAWLTSKEDVESGRPLMFTRKAIPIEMTEDAKANLRKKSKGLTMNDAMKDIDFGSIIGEDDD